MIPRQAEPSVSSCARSIRRTADRQQAPAPVRHTMFTQPHMAADRLSFACSSEAHPCLHASEAETHGRPIHNSSRWVASALACEASLPIKLRCRSHSTEGTGNQCLPASPMGHVPVHNATKQEPPLQELKHKATGRQGLGLWATSCPQGCHRRSHLRSLCTKQAPGSQCLHLWGTSLPTRLHSRSHSRPRQPTRRSREGAPLQAATLGNTSMAPADPRYMPDVERETALARSWGGIHCSTGRRLNVSAMVGVGSMGSAMAPCALR